MSKLNYSNNENRFTPMWRRVGIIALALLAFFPSAFALAGVIELAIRMGHGIGMYADFGHTAGEVAQAWAVLLFYAGWLIGGLLVAIKVFREQWALRWLVIQTIVTWLVILPANAFYLLGLAHV